MLYGKSSARKHLDSKPFMKTNTENLTSLNLYTMKVSKPVKQIFEAWGSAVERPTAAIFDQAIRFCIENGFEPSGQETRNDPQPVK